MSLLLCFYGQKALELWAADELMQTDYWSWSCLQALDEIFYNLELRYTKI